MRRHRWLVFLLIGIVLVGGGAIGIVASGAFRGPQLTPAQIAARAEAARLKALLAKERRDAALALDKLAVALPTKKGSLEPALPSQLFAKALPSHEVVGFVPYWDLSALGSADYADSTILCFYGVSTTANGSLDESGPQWGNAATTLSSPAFSSFVAEAHASGDEVLLTLATADDSVIAGLIKHPQATSTRLATGLVALVKADGLDGVDIDVEGTVTSDRSGYVAFATDLTAALRKQDPTGTLLLDTYAGAAGPAKDFFDVAKLAPLVNAIFVEGYDLNGGGVAAANAPLVTNDLGYSETQTLIQYTHLVPADKLILGVPFYGNDFTTRSDTPGAALKSVDPEAVTYAAVAAVGRTAYWDPVAASPYTRFQRDGSPHETYYDDPLSLAAKTALASDFHLLGVGAWAFGMEGGDAAMVNALAGDAAVVKLHPAS